ncbi:MAG: cation-translocating P-type ATPase [Candidatus Peregrinibacteria bacterium]|nr:cation-translocating P-type ATPase [Candidatus Peregrinibacteria bacterium]
MATLSKNYLETGLSSAQAAANLAKFGPNEIKTKKEFTALKILISQFTSFLIVILIASGLISIYLNELIDGIAILAIVLINAIIGFIQEYKAENAVKALKSLVVQTCIVLRDGTEKEIPIHDLVPEDIILLSEGEKIPADLEVIESFSLKADESILTGESIPNEKKAGKGKSEAKAPCPAECRASLLFKGTIIVNGRGKAKVIGTGMNTEFGKIVNLLSKEEKTQSLLSIQLDRLGKQIGIITLILIIVLFIIGYLKHISAYEMLFVSVSLGVSTIPEGMPIIVTLTLAIGVQLLARKNAIVRKMNAIETLGATTVICSDKTGTLTMNEMTVKKVFTNFNETSIPGVGYTWTDKISLKTKEDEKLLEICENCNNSFVDKNILGDPTEIALKILARKANQSKTYKKLDEITFTSDRKMMSTLNLIDNKKYVLSKGAFEEILKNCTHISIKGKIRAITAKDKQLIEKTAISYAEEALRVLGFAYKEFSTKFTEDKLVFVGLVGMIDPPRKEVANSIKLAQQAGIQIKIITGDNPITAKAIGKSVGLKITNVITGDEMDKLNDTELSKLIYKTSIFARTRPEHKYRIVSLLQAANEVVAVTGDGVNDAPALKKADVGIAMGIKGTEATKEVADIVLKDDNFSTIITTIEQGRQIYNNILSFIKYMLAANLDGIMIVGLVTIIGFPLPLLPLQILWINLATDALPALALGQSKGAKGLMQEKPHPKDENMFRKFGDIIIVTIIIQTILNLVLYFYGLNQDTLMNINTSDLSIGSHTRTLIFTEIVIFELFFAFVCKGKDNKKFSSYFSNRSLNIAVLLSLLLQVVVIYLPFAQTIFKTIPLNIYEWVAITICSLTAFVIPAITEFLRKIFKKSI